MKSFPSDFDREENIDHEVHPTPEGNEDETLIGLLTGTTVPSQKYNQAGK